MDGSELQSGLMDRNGLWSRFMDKRGLWSTVSSSHTLKMATTVMGSTVDRGRSAGLDKAAMMACHSSIAAVTWRGFCVVAVFKRGSGLAG